MATPRKTATTTAGRLGRTHTHTHARARARTTTRTQPVRSSLTRLQSCACAHTNIITHMHVNAPCQVEWEELSEPESKDIYRAAPIPADARTWSTRPLLCHMHSGYAAGIVLVQAVAVVVLGKWPDPRKHVEEPTSQVQKPTF